MDFEQAYASSESYFGDLPERSLIAHAARLDPSKPVLDVGCGQGRNALWLARQGFAVDAVDPSRTAIEAVAATTTAENLAIRTILGPFNDVVADLHEYGGILVFGLIPILTPSDIRRLVGQLDCRAAPGALVWLTAFTTADPAYPELSRRWTEVEKGSLRSPLGTLRTYIEPGELRRLLPRWETVHWREGLGPVHRHGDGAQERHALAELVARKPAPSL